MAWPRFFVYTTLGTVAWNILLCGGGFVAGGAWQSVSDQVSGYSDVVKYLLVVVALGGAAWWGWTRILPRLRSRAA